MKQFRAKCKSKRFYYWKNRFEVIENSLDDPKKFWENWKRSSEIPSSKRDNNISGQKWFDYFSNLHKEVSNEEIPILEAQNNDNNNAINMSFTYEELGECVYII